MRFAIPSSALAVLFGLLCLAPVCSGQDSFALLQPAEIGPAFFGE